MEFYKYFALCCAGLYALPVYAQPKNALKRFLEKTIPTQTAPVQTAGSFSQAAQQAEKLLANTVLRKRPFRAPILEPLEKNIHHFIFTVSQQGMEAGFNGSGFVIAENLTGETKLWGVTAKHVLNAFQGELQVTFRAGDKNVTFPVKNVISGRKYGLNAALLQLPPQAAQVARPIPLEKEITLPGEPVFAFGFSKGVYQKLIREVLFSGSERVIARFPVLNQPKPGFCGSPVVNKYGRLVGIETGGYSPIKNHSSWYGRIKNNPRLKQQDIRRISEIVPTNRIILLLKEFYQTGAGRRTIIINGWNIGYLDVDEFIESIRINRQDGSFYSLDRNPFLEPESLESWLDASQTSKLLIQINKGRSRQRFYEIDLINKTITES